VKAPKVHAKGIREPSKAMCGAVSRNLLLADTHDEVTCNGCRGWMPHFANKTKGAL
jgi:hypothetical protein